MMQHKNTEPTLDHDIKKKTILQSSISGVVVQWRTHGGKEGGWGSTPPSPH